MDNKYTYYPESIKEVKIPYKKWEKVNKKKSFKTKYKWFKKGFKKKKLKYYIGTITTNINGVITVKKYTKSHPYITNKTDDKVHVTHKKDLSDYVLPSTDCQSKNKAIIKKAKVITKGKKSNRDKANAILKYVQKNKCYDDYAGTKYGAVKSLSVKKLNCVDSTHLVVALLRVCNIPVKYRCKDTKKAGHCWPKAYIGGKWLSGEATFHPKKNQFYVKFGSTKGLAKVMVILIILILIIII